MVNRRSVDFGIEYWGIEDLLAALNQGTRTRVKNLRLDPQECRGTVSVFGRVNRPRLKNCWQLNPLNYIRSKYD
ncbi:hypothetical protein [Microcoleus sp. LEGE 07076]|uniref:hypothetical protein n=1 Tax=Microcoleus sp. LEGE 07076 TaxID=915322 RepID=UPI00188294B2